MSRTFRNSDEMDRRTSGRFDREFRRHRQAQRAINPSDSEMEKDQ